jgi:4-alpha-glucanotransferase
VFQSYIIGYCISSLVMTFPRSSGILLHPTSLPSPYGIGDLGDHAYEFIDFLQRTKQTYWQILPLGPTGYGNSPYLCYSAIAGNPLLISPERLVADGWLQMADLQKLPDFPSLLVDFDQVIEAKIELLDLACYNFRYHGAAEDQQDFQKFIQDQSHWLPDYALFMAIHEHYQDAPWYEWPKSIASRQSEALAEHEQLLHDRIFYYQFVQFIFHRQWLMLKAYARDRGIQIIGDIPIYVAHDSADVWANQKSFQLDPETGEAAMMAGVPPDYFSETGQLWGNPVYNWEHLQATNFAWWIGRFQALLKLVDIIRIDHFRGFEAYWAVPQGEKTAERGEWITAPGMQFFQELEQQLGHLPILAEDLGVITPEVEALRDRFEFPGMKVLQFAFGSDNANGFLPFNHSRNFVVYTGTHDNDTTIGWFNSTESYERDRVLRYLGGISSVGINWDLIRIAFSSVANQVILPMQDVLGLGNAARMNLPGTIQDNWQWRYHNSELTPEIEQQLLRLTETFGRENGFEQSGDE